MRILYSAIDQVVPGAKGGSVHVTAVAEGLARLGHEVHVLTSPGDGPFPSGTVKWMPMAPPLGRQQLRWMRRSAVRRVAASIKPDVIMERYYNFGGEAVLDAHAVRALAVLEVNAPVIDHPGSRKAVLDRALLVKPMQRWRARICAAADIIVSPSATILPRQIPRERILELEWGADTERFHPGAAGSLPFTPPSGTVAVFAGAFRNWHGAIHLARAVRILRERGRQDLSALFIGDGPELPSVKAAAEGVPGIVFTGAIPHAAMPAALASAHIGVAPFDIGAHKPLALGFYWSPLKMFEYMASGLPVVAPAVARIPQLVGHEREGLLYSLEDGSEAAHASALADTLAQLADNELRNRLGAAARDRASRDYSWAAHCSALDAAFRERKRR